MKNIQNIVCSFDFDSISCLSGQDIVLPPNEEFELVIDYPLHKSYIKKIKTGKNGMGYVGILKKIYTAYQYVYDHEDYYDVWGHYIDDLRIEGIRVDLKKKKIDLSMGS